MATQQRREQQAEPEKHGLPQRDAVIGKYVLHALGQPGDLQQVQVRWLWEDHYRVNVLVGADAASVKVAHSYFLVADAAGNVLASVPEIAKAY
jgi:hypothetical protein